MDSDDIALPERFSRQSAYLTAHRECVAVGSTVLLVDADGDPIWDPPIFLGHEEIDRSMMEGNSGVIMHPSVMFRRSAYEAIGGYASHYQVAGDYDLFLRLAEQGRLANLDEVHLKYRLHSRSVGSTRRASARGDGADHQQHLPATRARVSRGHCPMPRARDIAKPDASILGLDGPGQRAHCSRARTLSAASGTRRSRSGRGRPWP